MSFTNKKITENPRAKMPKKHLKAFLELLTVQASSSNEKLIYRLHAHVCNNCIYCSGKC